MTSDLFKFCSYCGKYLEPHESEVAYDSQGEPKTTCRGCKKGVYRERISGAIKDFFKKSGKHA